MQHLQKSWGGSYLLDRHNPTDPAKLCRSHVSRNLAGQPVPHHSVFQLYFLPVVRVMTRRRHQLARVASACVCMLAVAFLHAPLAAALWAAQTMPCCTGDHCPIAAHHHQKTPAKPAPEMNCGHDLGGLMSCTMSCCESTDRPMVASLAFLPSHVSPVITQLFVTPAPAVIQAIELPRSTEPLSPPPKSRTAAL